MPSRSLCLAVVLVTILTFASPVSRAAPASPATKGDRWDVTSRISMEGMQMPAQTHQVCASKDWQAPPGALSAGQNCTISDLRSTGAKTTWKMSCSSPDMSGEGEITRTGADAYTGAIRMESAEGNVTINLSGKRTGECDYQDTAMTPAQSPAASQKLDADLQKIQADACRGLAESLQLTMLTTSGMGCDDAATREIYCDKVFSAEGTSSLIERGSALPGETWQDALDFCADAEGKTAYCAQFNTPSGFTQIAGLGTGPGSPQETIATFCGLSAAQLEEDRQALCTAAATGTSELVFLARFCPAEAMPIAEKECAGRSFTSMGASPYAQFCMNYATVQAQQPAADSEAPPDDSKGKKSKKFLSKIWKH